MALTPPPFMRTQKFANFAETTLAQELSSNAPELFVTDLSKFPLIAVGSMTRLTISDDTQEPEIIEVILNDGVNPPTIERAKEGTVAKVWPPGAVVAVSVTAEALQYTNSVAHNGVVWVQKQIAQDVVVPTGFGALMVRPEITGDLDVQTGASVVALVSMTVSGTVTVNGDLTVVGGV